MKKAGAASTPSPKKAGNLFAYFSQVGTIRSTPGSAQKAASPSTPQKRKQPDASPKSRRALRLEDDDEEEAEEEENSNGHANGVKPSPAKKQKPAAGAGVTAGKPKQRLQRAKKLQAKSKLAAQKKKQRQQRRRMILDDEEDDDEESGDPGDDSEDDYEPSSSAEESEDDSEYSEEEEEEESEASDESEMEDDDEVPIRTPRKRKSPAVKASPRTPATPARRNASPAASPAPATPLGGGAGSGGGGGAAAIPVGQSYDDIPWITPEQRRDAKGRRPDDPDYDGRTLYVPQAAYKKMTPLEQQYWDVKRKYFDVIIFCKVGKFYEVFNYDAEICVQELGLAYMRGKRPHAGFPEPAYEKFARQLLQRGYRVGRLEQTETPQELQAHNRTAGRNAKRKVVQRELCGLRTKGSVVDSEILDSEDANFLMSICEVEEEEEHTDGTELSSPGHDGSGDGRRMRRRRRRTPCRIGVCFLDTSLGSFHVTEFEDDLQRSQLRTILAQIRPVELLSARRGLSLRTLTALRGEMRRDAIRTELDPETEFWGPRRTLEELRKKDYFAALPPPEDAPEEKEEDGGEGLEGCERWPVNLVKIAAEMTQGMSALGACVWYLQRLHLDQETLKLGQFQIYSPDTSHHLQGRTMGSGFGDPEKVLVLDGQTLANLDVLVNSEGGEEGTLFAHVNHTLTAFGRRRLRDWLARPLGDPKSINARLDAVEELMKRSDLRDLLETSLKKLPDLERCVSRIHSFALKQQVRAIMYTNIDARKMNQFLTTLNGFKAAQKLLTRLGDPETGLKSLRLRQLCAIASTTVTDLTDPKLQVKGLRPDLTFPLNHFDRAFDHHRAKQTGQVIPPPGGDQTYDELNQKIKDFEEELQEHLQEHRRYFRDNTIKYVHRNREQWQLEIKKKTLDTRGVPDEFSLLGQTTTVRRYWTPAIQKIAPQLQEATEAKEFYQRDLARLQFERFSGYLNLWNRAVECLAELDCLRSLAVTSVFQGDHSCRPEFLELEQEEEEEKKEKGMAAEDEVDRIIFEDQEPQQQQQQEMEKMKKEGEGKDPRFQGLARLELRNCVHPAVATALASSVNFRPTSTNSHGSAAGVVGSQQFIPNDFLIGCPGENPARFLLVTGSNMSGKSTALRQTCIAVIMAHLGCFVPADKCRLTPVDRIFTRVGANDRIMQGQSTFQVELEETATILSSATSRSLVILDELGRGTSTFDGTAIAYAVVCWLSRRVKCMTLFATHYHMLLSEFEDDPRIAMYHMACRVGANDEDVTFLYRFAKGSSPHSHGINVAKLAGLPSEVIQRAREQRQAFEIALAQAHGKNLPGDSRDHLQQSGSETGEEEEDRMEIVEDENDDEEEATTEAEEEEEEIAVLQSQVRNILEHLQKSGDPESIRKLEEIRNQIVTSRA